MVNSFTTREKHCLSKVDCRKHNNPVGGRNSCSAWSRIGASHSNFFHLRLRIDVLFLERAAVPDDFTAMTARDDVGRFALLTNVDCDTLSVPGAQLQRPGQPELQGHRRQWRQRRADAELQPGGVYSWTASILVDHLRAGCSSAAQIYKCSMRSRST